MEVSDLTSGKCCVSILIPCYNHEKYVVDCLDSIWNQTYSNYEIIICDDASKDGSVEQIKTIEQKFTDRNIRFVLLENETNQGITKNINRMLKKATGEYIKIIASDDMLYPNYLETMVKFMEHNKEIKLSFSNCICVKDTAKYVPDADVLADTIFDTLPDCKNNVFERLYLCNFIPAPAVMIRKSVLDEFGGYDETIAIEDLEMILHILSVYPDSIAGIEECLVYYRMNPSSISSAKKNAGAKKRIQFMFKNSMAIAKKYKKFVSHSIYTKRVSQLYISYILNRIHLIID